jgi:hypothetical protein
VSFRLLSRRVADSARLAGIRIRGILRIPLRILKITAHFLAALVLAPIVIPIGYLLRRWSPKDPKGAPLPVGIPTRAEMKGLEAHIADGDKSALRIWLRGAFYFEAVETHGESPESAAKFAHKLAEQANTPDGFAVRVQVGA